MTPQIIVAMLAMGMALSFVLADRDSPTSRALSLFLAAIGVTIIVRAVIELPLLARAVYPLWGGILAVPQVLAFIFANEWILRIRRTIPARGLQTTFADNLLRLAQLLAVVYGVLALLFPQVRAQQFLGAAFAAQLQPGFILFGVPLGLSMMLGIGAGLITLNRRPDIAERQRLLALAIASPFMASGIVLPLAIAPVLTAFGLLILLVGAVQYHVIQGRRAQFMSRFLAPQVADMVRSKGFKSATRHQTLEISVVCSDLRGFTAVSLATDSREVIGILREYYDMVGEEVSRVGGTIKDQAGDGVLVLVGAPLWSADHASRAINLAHAIRRRGVALCQRWATGERRLGVGVGIATGYVTVGVIGAASRLEYTAVGSAVNLASRLCGEAGHADVLVDQRTRELLAPGDVQWRLDAREPLMLKGFSQPVQNFALASG